MSQQHEADRSRIVHPALLEAFDGDWYYPWFPDDWPEEDQQHPNVQRAIREGWAEWIESSTDLEAVKQGFVFDLSRDRHGKPVYWYDGGWTRYVDGILVKIPMEVAEAPKDPEVKYIGRGDVACRFSEVFIRYTKESMASEPGDPYRLIHWQRKAMLTVFGWVRRQKDRKGREQRVRRYRQVLLEIAKKGGKSDFGSIVTLILVRADNTRKAYVYGVATDKRQAGIVFREAKDYVDASPELREDLFVNDSRVDRRISHIATGSYYEVVAADASSNDGFDAHGVIFDELHQQRDRRLYTIFRRAGQARLQPLEFVITTYGRTLKSIWGEVHLKAKAVLQERSKKITQFVMIASAEAIQVVVMEPAAEGATRLAVRRLEQPIDAGEVIEFESSEQGGQVVKVRLSQPAKRFQRYIDVEPIAGRIEQYSEGTANDNQLAPERLDHAIRRANPSVDIVTPHQRIKEEILDAEGPQAEAEAKRFNLNIVAGDGNLWLSGAAWMACGRRRIVMSQLINQRCFGALDLSQTNDLTAFWLAFPSWPANKKFGKVSKPLVKLVGLVWVPSHEIEKREEVEEIPYRALAESRYLPGGLGYVSICDGESIDYGQVGREITKLCEFFKVQAIAYDPYRSVFVVDPYLLPAGLRCYPHRQGALSMGPPSQRFSSMLKRHQLAHGHHPILDQAVEGCVLTKPDKAGNSYPAKDKSTSRIDSIITAIMANGWACDPPSECAAHGAWSGSKGSGMMG